MKNKYTFILQFCILILMSSCASYYSKDNNLSSTLVKSQKNIDIIGKKISTVDNQKLKEAYTKLNKTSAELFPVLEKCNDKYSLKPEYVSTLQETEKTMKALVNNYNTSKNKVFILNAITQDYEAKLKTIKNTAKNDATTKIKVTVNSNEEEGFFVFGKLSFEQNKDIKRYRFNQPTQNAILDIVPGYYLFWLEKEGRVGEPELHLIMSNAGEEEKKLVLKTPK